MEPARTTVTGARASVRRWLVREPAPLAFPNGSLRAAVDWPAGPPPTPIPAYVVHWNAPDWCVDTVKSFDRSDVAVRVTVIDNGGLTAEAAGAFPPSTRVVTTSVNGGYTGGANHALDDWAERGGEFAIIACHDVELDPRAVRAMLAAMASHDVGIVGIGSGGKHPPVSPPAGEPIDLASVSWVTGACMLIRHSCARSVGPFDEAYGSYVEDADYGFRAVDDGWRVVSVPGIVARWHGHSSADASILPGVNSLRLCLKRHRRPVIAVWVAVQFGQLLEAAFRALPGTRRRPWGRVTDRWRIIRLGVERHGATRRSDCKRTST